MKALSYFSNEQLLTHAQELVKTERKIYRQVLESLEEIERRKLYLQRGYSSLFSFCTEFLQYSSSAAMRRIESMRLIKGLEVEDKKGLQMKLEKGDLNLTHLSQVSRLVRQKPAEFKSSQAKVKLLQEVEKTSSRECEQRLYEKGLEPKIKREHFQVVSENEARLSVNLDQKTQELLKEFVDLTAHQNPFGKKEVALTMALEMAVLEAKKRKGIIARKKDSQKTTSASEVISTNAAARTSRPSLKKARSRYISRAVKQEVYKSQARAGCCYVDPASKKRCRSNFMLEMDHIKEFSKGGGNTLDNLRLYCRSHNQLRNRQRLRVSRVAQINRK